VVCADAEGGGTNYEARMRRICGADKCNWLTLDQSEDCPWDKPLVRFVHQTVATILSSAHLLFALRPVGGRSASSRAIMRRQLNCHTQYTTQRA